MKQIIPIQEKDGKQLVSARNLYDALGLNPAVWSRWYRKNIITNDFANEYEDWTGFNIELNGNKTMDFALTIDFAKKLAMLSRTDKGEQVRNYFIEVEKKTKQVSQLTPDQIIAQGFALAMKRVEVLQQENDELKPKALFADVVTSSKDSILIGQFAVFLKQNGVDMGQNKLFEYLRNNGYLCSYGQNRNQPTSYSLNLKLFELDERAIMQGGETKNVFTTKMTGKGQVYFTKHLMQGYKNQLIVNN